MVPFTGLRIEGTIPLHNEVMGNAYKTQLHSQEYRRHVCMIFLCSENKFGDEGNGLLEFV
ncbi:hypothetical protein TanjilG_13944 [Lupinus angustifolius]|uniref:Uncharacterized protein n=1 Tax=Lupinus angustifolius TaxID=3871 RepID=A0A1J7I283_LUPAN|nr:hypothetical protein TanjilG_13944 [Lupinus angustifolius]